MCNKDGFQPEIINPHHQMNSTSIHQSAHVDAAANIAPGCVIKYGTYIGRGVQLEAGVYVGANVVFVDALSDQYGSVTWVKQHAHIGDNSTINSGVVISAKSEVRPGSVVTRSVPPNAIVAGNPANIIGYVDAACENGSRPKRIAGIEQSRIEVTPVKRVTIHHFPVIPDLRGNLTVGEFDRQIPFIPRRYFVVFDVPTREIRGEHAHHSNHQFLICLRGSCAVVADDGVHKIEINLDAPNRGVYLPPMTWGIQYKYSTDAILLVFASDYYDASDYIRDYGEFLAAIR
jgi:UDP-2-acetamido-3-amino-2,3-dideoxy-glucuronate N-acetyltransferase